MDEYHNKEIKANDKTERALNQMKSIKSRIHDFDTIL